MPPGARAETGVGMPPWANERRFKPYQSRDVITCPNSRLTPLSPRLIRLYARLAKPTNSNGQRQRPYIAAALATIERTSSTGLSLRHWLQHRCALATLPRSIAEPPFDIGTSSSTSIAYGWPAFAAGMGSPHIQQGELSCSSCLRMRCLAL